MKILETIKIIILGIVEGITEWLPVSSTGHMILLDEFIKLNITPEFKEMFFVVIQLGAIMAVVFLYFNKLNPFSPKKNPLEKRNTWVLWFKVIFAIIPAGIIGVFFDDWINEKFYNYQTVAVTLILYGIFFILIENRNKDKIPKIDTLKGLSYKTAFFIGVFQVLSLIPGTSRSGATIVGAMLIGTSRDIAAEFTFFLAIPVMFGASLVKILKFGLVRGEAAGLGSAGLLQTLKTGLSFTGFEAYVLSLGTIVSFVVSIITIKFLMGYIKKNDFKAFGYYRIVLGIVVLVYFSIF